MERPPSGSYVRLERTGWGDNVTCEGYLLWGYDENPGLHANFWNHSPDWGHVAPDMTAEQFAAYWAAQRACTADHDGYMASLKLDGSVDRQVVWWDTSSYTLTVLALPTSTRKARRRRGKRHRTRVPA